MLVSCKLFKSLKHPPQDISKIWTISWNGIIHDSKTTYQENRPGWLPLVGSSTRGRNCRFGPRGWPTVGPARRPPLRYPNPSPDAGLSVATSFGRRVSKWRWSRPTAWPERRFCYARSDKLSRQRNSSQPGSLCCPGWTPSPAAISEKDLFRNEEGRENFKEKYLGLYVSSEPDWQAGLQDGHWWRWTPYSPEDDQYVRVGQQVGPRGFSVDGLEIIIIYSGRRCLYRAMLPRRYSFPRWAWKSADLQGENSHQRF